MTIVLKAARYSASPRGGDKPPLQAILTLNPKPLPAPHYINYKIINIR